MLQQMREKFRYLKWLLVIVVFMFVVWAAATYTGGQSGQRENTAAWAAQVNGTTIEGATFQSYARQLDNTYQSLFGEQYAQQRGLVKIGRQAINQLVDEELMYQEATRQGLRVTPEEVAMAITRDPNFQENGRFIGVARYRDLFRAGNVGVGEYEAQVRRRLLIETYRNLIGNGVVVTDAQVEKEFLRRNQKTTVEYVLIDPKHLPAPPPASDEEAARYYEAHRDRFARGEGRTGTYVLISPQELARAITVADDEVLAAYNRDLPTKYTVREQRRASHILFKVATGVTPADASRIEAKARDVLKKARSGSDFAELARKYSEDSSASNGGDLNFFGRGQMVKEFEEAAFSLPVGAVSDLVRTNYGFHIIKVTETREPHTMTFEEVKDRLREELKLAQARSQAADRAAALAKASAGGGLEAVARSQGLTPTATGPVRPGDAVAGLAASQQVVARMMTLDTGKVSEAIAIPSGQVVVQVTGVVPDETRPLSEVRSQVNQALAEEGQRSAVLAAIHAPSAASGLAALAKQFKVEIKTEKDLARGSALPGVPRNAGLDRQIETLSPGALGDPVTTTAGILVLSVKERNEHRDELASQRDATRDSLVSQDRERLVRSVLRQLRDQGHVKVNAPLVDAIDRS
jgi:peptidyl-prolyl cis-trans isomerase D